MNRLFYKIFIICSMIICSIYTQTNLSPRSASTAQTFGNFSRGLDAVNWNPANLGYYGHPINLVTAPNEKYNSIELMEKDTLSVSVDSTQKYYSVQLIASQDKKHVKETIKTFHNQFGKNIPSTIFKMNSLYKLQVGSFIDRYYAEILRDSLIEKGYKDAWIISHNYPLEKPRQILTEQSYYIEFLNMGAMLSNSSANASWINTYILNGGDIGKLDEASKNEIISVFPDDGWRINPIINYKLGFRINNFALQVTPDVYGEFVIPRGLFELAFEGNEMSKPIDFSGRNNQFQAVLPVSISYGTKVNISFLDNFINRSYVGVSAKYLAGLAYLESDIHTFIVQPTQNPSLNTDTVSMKAHVFTKYSLANAYMEIDTIKAFNYSFNTEHANQIPSGTGYAFDLGLIMDINDELSTSIAITNLLGEITWGNNTAYKHELKLESQIAMEEETQVQMDSLLQEGIEIDTNIAVISFKTKYPGALILGAEYSLDKINLASNLKFGFSNELGSSTKPRLSFAAELNPVKWCSLLGGTSIGGHEGFQWGSGIRMRFLCLQMMFAYSEYGGMLKSAKGFSLSASASFIF